MAEKPSPGAPADIWRVYIAEASDRARFYAENANRYAEFGDDAGLNRSVRLMAQHAVSAAEGLERSAEAARQDRALRDMGAAAAARL